MWPRMLMTTFALCSLNVKEVLENDPDAYYSKDELQENLLVMYNSLIETKDNSIANGKLLDVIRQVRAPTPSAYLRHAIVPWQSLLISAADRQFLTRKLPCVVRAPAGDQQNGFLVRPLGLHVEQSARAGCTRCEDWVAGAGAMLWAGHGEAGHPPGVLAPCGCAGHHHPLPGPGLLQVSLLPRASRCSLTSTVCP